MLITEESGCRLGKLCDPDALVERAGSGSVDESAEGRLGAKQAWRLSSGQIQATDFQQARDGVGRSVLFGRFKDLDER